MKEKMQSYVKRGNRLIEKGDTKSAINLMMKGFDYYSRRILKAVNPYATEDAGMLVIVLRYLADQIEKKNPGAKEFAERMSKILVFPKLEEIEKIEKPNRN